MSIWLTNELSRITAADDLHIAPFREDGNTYGTPTWIWSVTVDNALYVRAYHGRQSRWYQAARRQHAGRITSAGLTKEVIFEPVEDDIQEAVDAAYRAKYHDSSYLQSMLSPRAKVATIRVIPVDCQLPLKKGQFKPELGDLVTPKGRLQNATHVVF